jgi:hypothetical protein
MRVSCNSCRRASVIGGSLAAAFIAIFKVQEPSEDYERQRAKQQSLIPHLSEMLREMFHLGVVELPCEKQPCLDHIGLFIQKKYVKAGSLNISSLGKLSQVPTTLC